MYLDDYLNLKKFGKMVFELVNMFCQALHNGKTATEAKNIQLYFCALCPDISQHMKIFTMRQHGIKGAATMRDFNRDFKGFRAFCVMPCNWVWWFVFIFLLDTNYYNSRANSDTN